MTAPDPRCPHGRARNDACRPCWEDAALAHDLAAERARLERDHSRALLASLRDTDPQQPETNRRGAALARQLLTGGTA